MMMLLAAGQYSSASDMYAFAVLLNEVLTEQVPFPGRNYVEIVQSVGTFCHRPECFQPELADALGCALKSCIHRCWHQDSKLRMSFHELSSELNHLLRKAVENARVGNHASSLTPHHRRHSREIETSIVTLAGWLTSSCHLAQKDALPLAHSLVTVKHVTSTSVLAQVLQRNPEFLASELGVSTVHVANICTALNINVMSASGPVAYLSRPVSASRIPLKSLKSAQLCELFDHCHIYELNEFVMMNKLNGTQTYNFALCPNIYPLF